MARERERERRFCKLIYKRESRKEKVVSGRIVYPGRADATFCSHARVLGKTTTLICDFVNLAKLGGDLFCCRINMEGRRCTQGGEGAGVGRVTFSTLPLSVCRSAIVCRTAFPVLCAPGRTWTPRQRDTREQSLANSVTQTSLMTELWLWRSD